MKINKNWQFDFCNAIENIFIYVCSRDDDLRIAVNVFELENIDFDNTMTFEQLVSFDEFDVYYNGELVKWESL